MKKMFDSHAHYYDEKYKAIDGGVEKILESEEFKKSVGKIINIGTNYDTSLLCIEQAKKYQDMYVTVGIHPEDCQDICKLSVAQEIEKIYSLVCDAQKRQRDKIVGIGEIGFDYHGENPNRELQKEYFEKQMELAKLLDLPVVVHDRDSHEDTYNMLKKFPTVRGVMHSCSLSHEMARDFANNGFFISFSGTVTFKNAPRVRLACEAVPLDKILIETDAPYLAPHPHRGKINTSELMIHTAQAVADVHGVSLEEIIQITYENACRLFRIEP